MALSAKQKEIVYLAFIKIVKDPESLFQWFVPNTKPQMVAIIEAKVNEEKLQLEAALTALPDDTALREAALTNDIAIYNDLTNQL